MLLRDCRMLLRSRWGGGGVVQGWQKVGRKDWHGNGKSKLVCGKVHLPLHLNGEFGVMVNHCAEFLLLALHLVYGELSLDSL